VADGSLFVKNSALWNNTTTFNNAGIIETDVTYGNTTTSASLDGFIGTETAGAVDPSAVDSWFSSVTFKGAVQASDDWTAGWTVAL